MTMQTVKRDALETDFRPLSGNHLENFIHCGTHMIKLMLTFPSPFGESFRKSWCELATTMGFMHFRPLSGNHLENNEKDY